MNNSRLHDKAVPIIGGKNPCQCVEKLTRSMNKHKVSCAGILVISDPSGNCRKGLHTIQQPKVIGGRVTTGLVVFNFCPFCGKRLVLEGRGNVSAKNG